ncbi:hypothetical protein ACWT_4393 [Actinoplanes sp. SE50]|uniref:hypothetical protein n=1 Tax=unclassified Actinoplanes TaxID=2626549 RepID=UPI00023ECB4B|nr:MULTISPECIES: hypothetical protein [unclassified Actinoplanes]AEV85413.1 hypothetical protein ACPL_4522 [Actinoplanes sp. SE50/110]ATO83808.1 hypothetical protein ACWT_4393 [Actinoplanes sp. SE50]SLM01216.1 uncharacterized protein ACSP50_4452 [Actinoplanes sp. SE50/110]
MNTDTIALLKSRDGAPARALTREEKARQAHLLHRILTDPAPVRPAAARSRSWAAFWTTAGIGAVAMAAVAVVVTVGPGVLRSPAATGLTTVDVASWTSTSMRLPSAAQEVAAGPRDWCMKNTVGDPNSTATRTVVSAELRGVVGSLIMKQGDDYSLCMAGRDRSGFAELLDAPTPLLDAEVRPMTGGGHGDGKSAFSYVVGRAGDAVTRVTLTVGARTVDAHIEAGWWTAWWPNPEATGDRPEPEVTVTVTVTLRDGRSRTAPLSYDQPSAGPQPSATASR